MFKIFKISLANNVYEVKITKRKNCKKIILKANLKNKSPQISIPYYLTYDQGIDFFKNNYLWFENQINRTSQIDFQNCAEINLQGIPYKINYILSKSSYVKANVELQRIEIFSKIESKRGVLLKKFLKALALEYFIKLSQEKVDLLNLSFNKVIITDSNNKWGSCSSSGNLRYNFRLIMAPLFVIDYIVAHEVAHLKEFNHQKAFWQIVDQLHLNKHLAQHWIKKNGITLY
ncbi:M48 family metallopeptidase [Candidatus Hepatincolaceae symbiont of Richtersius coronifer]